MQGKAGLALAIVLTILALLIGLFGIALLIGIGEAANNVFAAFAAVSFPFALLAGVFSWITPRARWPIAAAMCAPVAVISVVGSWSSSYLIPGALWTVALTCAGAYGGSRLRMSRSITSAPPPS